MEVSLLGHTVCQEKVLLLSVRKDFLEKFFLEGFCTLEKQILSIDNNYVFKPDVLIDEKPFWKGFKSTRIQWSSLDNVWQIINIEDESLIAFHNATKSGFFQQTFFVRRKGRRV